MLKEVVVQVHPVLQKLVVQETLPVIDPPHPLIAVQAILVEVDRVQVVLQAGENNYVFH